MRTTQNYILEDIKLFKSQLLNWSQQFEVISWLDSNEYQDTYSSYDAILAIEEETSIKLERDHNAFSLLKDYQKQYQDFLFGFLTYDLKNDVESLSSDNQDELHFPSLYFFKPKKIIFIKDHTATFSYLNYLSSEIENDYSIISCLDTHAPKKETIIIDYLVKQRVSKSSYLKKCEQLMQRIHRGDIYEINYCMEFYMEQTSINPIKIFKQLNKISSPPFANFFRCHNFYVCSASPERYIKKIGQKVLSQPIKGTSKRGSSDEEDADLITSLKNNQKERSENIMIVDLVRNDLSKNALKGSVQVEELCEVYTFKQVHQLISTISAEIPSGTSPISILQNTFPMGSMTGAPKIAAMKIIEEIEDSKRGLYSGSVGYFTPNGDFDFNVVIRSILHNAKTQYTSFFVGSAITSLSDPVQEYEECLLKGKAMMQVLTER